LQCVPRQEPGNQGSLGTRRPATAGTATKVFHLLIRDMSLRLIDVVE
jgi:hypothetical protein